MILSIQTGTFDDPNGRFIWCCDYQNDVRAFNSLENTNVDESTFSLSGHPSILIYSRAGIRGKSVVALSEVHTRRGVGAAASTLRATAPVGIALAVSAFESSGTCAQVIAGLVGARAAILARVAVG